MGTKMLTLLTTLFTTCLATEVSEQIEGLTKKEYKGLAGLPDDHKLTEEQETLKQKVFTKLEENLQLFESNKKLFDETINGTDVEQLKEEQKEQKGCFESITLFFKTALDNKEHPSTYGYGATLLSLSVSKFDEPFERTDYRDLVHYSFKTMEDDKRQYVQEHFEKNKEVINTMLAWEPTEPYEQLVEKLVNSQ